MLGRAGPDSHGDVGLKMYQHSRQLASDFGTAFATHLFNDLGKGLAVEVLQLMTKLPQANFPTLVGITPRDDGDHSVLDRIAAECNLRRVPSAEALSPGERETGQALEERTLARRLAADDDNLILMVSLGRRFLPSR